MKTTLSKMKSNVRRKLVAGGAVVGATVASVSAAIPTTELTGAIADGITAAEALLGAGLALTAIFIVARAIKKGAAKIG